MRMASHRFKGESLLSKVGRNDLCPCGSGKKYKRCCLGKETSAVESILRLVTTEEAAAREAVIAEPEAMPAAPEAVVRPESKLTLTKLKKMVARELKWEHPAHEQLALQLIESMREQYERELIFEALVLWNGFSRQKDLQQIAPQTWQHNLCLRIAETRIELNRLRLAVR